MKFRYAVGLRGHPQTTDQGGDVDDERKRKEQKLPTDEGIWVFHQLLDIALEEER